MTREIVIDEKDGAEIVARYRELLAMGLAPLDAAIQALDEQIKGTKAS